MIITKIILLLSCSLNLSNIDNNSHIENLKQDTIKSNANFESLLKISKGTYASWSSQLDAVKNGVINILNKNNIILLSYSKSRKIKEIPDDEIFVYADDENKVRILTKNENLDTKLQNLIKYDKINLFLEREKDLYIVDINWKINGKSLKTKCIVSHKYNCIVYEPIISNIFITKIDTYEKYL